MRTLHVVIPAGGAGTRLWPLSRVGRPKYLLPVGGSASLLTQAIERVAPLAADVTVVTSAQTAPLVEAEVADLPGEVAVLAEPAPKNSMPAIGWVAALVEARFGRDALVGSFAADHAITDVAAFRRVLADACAAAETGRIVTIGITPTHAATGYGYIRVGAPLPDAPAAAVAAFTEKPDAEDAAAYLASGKYLWNAGMFLSRCGVLLDALAETHPALAAHLRALAAAPAEDAADVLTATWPKLEAIAIDHAVAEPQAERGRMAVVAAGDIGWSDVGDYDALAERTPGGVVGPVRALPLDAPDSLVAAGPDNAGEVVVIDGIPDAVVVRSGRLTYVTTRSRAGHVADARALALDTLGDGWA